MELISRNERGTSAISHLTERNGESVSFSMKKKKKHNLPSLLMYKNEWGSLADPAGTKRVIYEHCRQMLVTRLQTIELRYSRINTSVAACASLDEGY